MTAAESANHLAPPTAAPYCSLGGAAPLKRGGRPNVDWKPTAQTTPVAEMSTDPTCAAYSPAVSPMGIYVSNIDDEGWLAKWVK